MINNDFELPVPDPFARDRGERKFFVAEKYSRTKGAELVVRDRIGRQSAVGFRDMALRGGLSVNEGAVVGEEDQSRRILVEPSHRLNAAAIEVRGEKAQYGRMPLRVARAFVTRGFV